MNTGTQAVLWVSVPLEVRIEKAGSRKVYVSARKVKWALDAEAKAESLTLSAFASPGAKGAPGSASESVHA